MHEIRQYGRDECLPLRIRTQLGALRLPVGVVVVAPEEDDGIERARLLGPATDQLGVAGDDVQAVLLVYLEKLRRLAGLNLVGAHFDDHVFLAHGVGRLQRRPKQGIVT